MKRVLRAQDNNGEKTMKSLIGKKTYISGVLSIIGAGIALYLGQIDAVQAFQILQVAIASMFLRSGLSQELR
jgi:hypothetical protein